MSPEKMMEAYTPMQMAVMLRDVQDSLEATRARLAVLKQENVRLKEEVRRLEAELDMWAPDLLDLADGLIVAVRIDGIRYAREGHDGKAR